MVTQVGLIRTRMVQLVLGTVTVTEALRRVNHEEVAECSLRLQRLAAHLEKYTEFAAGRKADRPDPEGPINSIQWHV